jgi:two-component system cell cycle sensor histidine kinase/response regulator CckA
MALNEKERARLKAELEAARQKVARLKKILGSSAATDDYSADEHLVRSLMDNALFALAVIDLADGSVLYANSPAQTLTGYQASDLSGMKLWDLVEPKERSTLFERLSVKASGQTTPIASYTYTIHRKDGTPLKVEGQGTPINYQGKRTLLILLKDVTVEEQLREQLRETQKLASVGTMAAGIAHDFNNIIYGIMLGAETVQRHFKPSDEAWPYLEQMRQSGRRAAQLIRQILSFSRRSQTETTALLLEPLIKESLSMLRATLPATVALEAKLCRADLMVLAEPTLIQQLLVNLCTNASQAMRETGGVIKVSLEALDLDSAGAGGWPKLEPGRYAQLMVSDDGPGIPPEARKHVFDPFFTTKPPGQGTGLGLSVVKSIMDRLNGDIRLESEVGQGATFTLLIPMATLLAPFDESRGELPGPPRGDESILVVDDEEIIRSVLKEVLSSLGYKVTVAADGMEAMDLFQDDPKGFDLIISDQTMPGLTGSALMELIHGIRPEVPVILCTGHSDILDYERAKALGACDFLMKPLEGREMAEIVARCLRGGSQQSL